MTLDEFQLIVEIMTLRMPRYIKFMKALGKAAVECGEELPSDIPFAFHVEMIIKLDEKAGEKE